MNAFFRQWGGLVLLILGFCAASVWVFTRSSSILHKRPVVIRIAHWQIERGPPAGIDAMIKRYEELNPRVKVVQMLIPGTVYVQWTRSNLTAGEGADLMEYGPWLQGMKDVPPRFFTPITQELMQPNPYNRGTPLEGVPWIDTFREGFDSQLASSPDPGQYYAIPLTEVSWRIFYNQHLFRELFGDEPLPQNFEDLRRLNARLLTRTGSRNNPPHLFAASRENAAWLAEPLVQSPMMKTSFALDRDGRMALYPRQMLGTYIEGRWRYNMPPMVGGLELLRELGTFMRPGLLQLTRDNALQEFMRREAVFISSGTWDATSLKELASFPVGVFRLPQPNRQDPVVGRFVIGRVDDGGGQGTMAFYLNRYSPHRAEALDFMRFMSSVEGSQLFTEHSGWLPMVRGVKIAPEIAPFKAQYDGYTNGANYTMLGTNVLQAFARNLHLVFSGPEGPAEFAKTMDASIPQAVRSDLEAEYRTSQSVVREQDGRIVGSHFAARESAEAARYESVREQLESTQADGETAMLQIEYQLALPAP